MLLSEIKAGQVVEVLNDGEIDKYLVCEINGVLVGINKSSTLGSLNYWFTDELYPKQENVDLLAVYDLLQNDLHVLSAIEDYDCLELVYTPCGYVCSCDNCSEVEELEKVIKELNESIHKLKEENHLLRLYI